VGWVSWQRSGCSAIPGGAADDRDGDGAGAGPPAQRRGVSYSTTSLASVPPIPHQTLLPQMLPHQIPVCNII